MQQQHPVPQQISSYQFHLVGDMTLKQFFEVGGGVLVAILIYSTSLPGLFKWPLVAISVILGAALAFFPLEERPLEQWILAFFRSIYSPTLYYWAQPAAPVKYFADETTLESSAGNAGEQPIKQSDHTTPLSGFLSRLEEGEKALLSRFVNPPVEPEVSQTTPQAVVPQPTVQVMPIAPVAVAPVAKEPLPIVSDSGPQNTTEVPATPTLPTSPPNGATSAQLAQFSMDAAPPSPPSQANIIVGQVMDQDGSIVEGAILEIKDVQGRPVRALRSNRAGHFMIVTPLSNGTYELEIDKQGMEFDKLSFEVKGEIIQPIAVRAKQGGVVANAN